MDNVIVKAVYHKCRAQNENAVIKAFLRLKQIYLSDADEKGYCGAVFDLPDALCYKVSGDAKIIDTVKKYYEIILGGIKDNVFCVIRNREYVPENGKRKRKDFKGHYYCGRGGETGAVKFIAELKNGETEEEKVLFKAGAFPGCAADILYFSASDDLIEPIGIENMAKTLVKGRYLAVKPCFSGEKCASDGVYYIGKEKGFSGVKRCKNAKNAAYRLSEYERKEIKPVAPETEARYLRKAEDAICDVLFGYYSAGYGKIRNVCAGSAALLAAGIMRLCGKLGKNEYFEISEELLTVCAGLTGRWGETEETRSMTAFFLRLAGDVMNNYSYETPSLTLLYSDAIKLSDINCERADEKNLCTLLCRRKPLGCAETVKKPETVKIPETVALAFFGESKAETEKRVSETVGGAEDLFLFLDALISVTGREYGLPLKKIIENDALMYSRLGFAESVSRVKKAVPFRPGKKPEIPFCLTAFERFPVLGCDRELIYHAAFLESLVFGSYLYGRCEKGDGKLCVTLLSDGYVSLADAFARCVKVVESVTLYIIVKDRGKIPSDALREKGVIFYEARQRRVCERAIKSSVYFRQITEGTTLTELIREARGKYPEKRFAGVPELKSAGKRAGSGESADGVYCFFDGNGEAVTVCEFFTDKRGNRIIPERVTQALSPDGAFKLILCEPADGTEIGLSVVLPDGRTLFDGERRQTAKGTVYVRKKKLESKYLFTVGILEDAEAIPVDFGKYENEDYFFAALNENLVFEKDVKIMEKVFEKEKIAVLGFDETKKTDGFAPTVTELFKRGMIDGAKLLSLCLAYMDEAGNAEVMDRAVTENGYPYSFATVCGKAAEALLNGTRGEKNAALSFTEKCRKYGRTLFVSVK